MSDWLIWQVVDSAFPTGLFAHSWGLESAWQHGEIRDAAALRVFTETAVIQAGHASLPFVNDGFDWPDRLAALDLLSDAFLTNEVGNRASRIQGRSLIATAARVWPSDALGRLERASADTCAHVAPLCGAILRSLDVPRASAQRMVLFGAARGVLSAAVRLGIAGSYEAQRLQHACAPLLEAVAANCSALGVSDLAQTAPLIDLFQARHDTLYSRLFQS
ncbi:MAG TPA: urease accessory UreF family protein [Vicinamibacterales bacterium]|nr:urease accessory UreF family protein [Vicinamibacterales bacterium]